MGCAMKGSTLFVFLHPKLISQSERYSISRRKIPYYTTMSRFLARTFKLTLEKICSRGWTPYSKPSVYNESFQILSNYA